MLRKKTVAAAAQTILLGAKVFAACMAVAVGVEAVLFWGIAGWIVGADLAAHGHALYSAACYASALFSDLVGLFCLGKLSE